MQSSIIEKSIGLLDALGDASRPLTFSEIVRASGLNKSTVHRLLSILTSEGLAQYDEGAKTYMLGHRLLHLARKARHGFEIQIVAFDEMQRLFALVEENVTIGVLHKHEVVYLRALEAEYDWGPIQPPGMREPVHSTATGKALVAFRSLSVRSAWLERHEFRAYTERTITSRSDFERELEAVRQRGFATSDRETVDHITGIAAPIFNYLGEPIAALNVWAPVYRHSLGDLLRWSEALTESARRISALIGANDNEEPASVVAQRGAND